MVEFIISTLALCLLVSVLYKNNRLHNLYKPAIITLSIAGIIAVGCLIFNITFLEDRIDFVAPAIPLALLLCMIFSFNAIKNRFAAVSLRVFLIICFVFYFIIGTFVILVIDQEHEYDRNYKLSNTLILKSGIHGIGFGVSQNGWIRFVRRVPLIPFLERQIYGLDEFKCDVLPIELSFRRDSQNIQLYAQNVHCQDIRIVYLLSEDEIKALENYKWHK